MENMMTVEEQIWWLREHQKAVEEGLAQHESKNPGNPIVVNLRGAFEMFQRLKEGKG